MSVDINNTVPSQSIACQSDVSYLRTRSRWTQELEDQLIALHRIGTPPNIFEFGSTPETQRALMESVRDALVFEKGYTIEQANALTGTE